MIPWAILSPQVKWHRDWFSGFRTGDHKCSYTLQWAPLFRKVAPSCGVTRTPSNTWFLGLIWAHNQMGLIGSAVFAQMKAQCPYTLQWDAPFPLKIAPSRWGDLDSHLIHGSLGQPKSSTQMAYRSVQPFLQGSLVWQTNRLTDHA